jgi:hypothetical protein
MRHPEPGECAGVEAECMERGAGLRPVKQAWKPAIRQAGLAYRRFPNLLLAGTDGMQTVRKWYKSAIMNKWP